MDIKRGRKASVRRTQELCAAERAAQLFYIATDMHSEDADVASMLRSVAIRIDRQRSQPASVVPMLSVEDRSKLH